MATKHIDINCDLGEGQTLADCQQDAQLMPFISRCNIACGGHAGNAATMQQSLLNAQQQGILCGAHPGYVDPLNFGRRSLNLPAQHIVDEVLRQIEQLNSLAQATQIPLSHIKLHGALYNDAEQQTELAEALCDAFASHYASLPLLVLPDGQMQRAAQSKGLSVLYEGFIDRAYLASGMLAPRSLAGSVFHSIDECLRQAQALAQGQTINTLDQQSLSVKADSLCLHGDRPDALALALALAAHLNKLGYQFR